MVEFRFGIQGYQQPKRDFKNVDFILTENPWDDFGYRTWYEVAITPKLIPISQNANIGSIRIIAKNGGKNFLNDASANTNYILTELPKGSISFLSGSIDEILFCLLTKRERIQFIDSMHLCLGNDIYMNQIEQSLLNSTIFRYSKREDVLQKLQYYYRTMRSELDGKLMVNRYLKLLEK